MHFFIMGVQFFPIFGKIIIKTEKFLKKEGKNKENNVDIAFTV